MSGTTAVGSRENTKTLIGLSIGFGVIVLLGANTHLVYVAISSEPDCIAHLRHGESNGQHRFSAATSSCSPKRAMQATHR